MKSKWFHLKEEAMRMRKDGKSIKDISGKLSIPLSTLSGWFRNVTLTRAQRKSLDKRWREGLQKARKHAALWHNTQKAHRLSHAEKTAEESLEKINFLQTEILELALAFLYFGEGAKGGTTSLGNSDPTILRFFVNILRKVYKVPEQQIRCDLHLRADQDPSKLRKYWSNTLSIPEKNFCKPSIDKRTVGSPTYAGYKGVCVVRCGRVEIKRKLMYIATKFCNEVTASGEMQNLSTWAVSSLGRAHR